jgi:phosphate transport system substrate-binding protein
LSAISPDLAKRLGTTLTPPWGTLLTDPGRLVRGSGNDGVTALVRAIPGSIGYVAYPYADFTKTPMAAIENKDGKLVDPSPAAFEASISSLSQSRTTATLIDPPGESAYPLIALSYLMLPKQHKDPAKQQAIAGIIRYALGPGQTIAERIGYIPFSPGAIDYVREELEPVSR